MILLQESIHGLTYDERSMLLTSDCSECTYLILSVILERQFESSKLMLAIIIAIKRS